MGYGNDLGVARAAAKHLLGVAAMLAVQREMAEGSDSAVALIDDFIKEINRFADAFGVGPAAKKQQAAMQADWDRVMGDGPAGAGVKF